MKKTSGSIYGERMKNKMVHRIDDDFIRIDASDFRPYEEIHLRHYSPHKHDRKEYTYSSNNFWVRIVFESRLWRVFEHLKDYQSCDRMLDIGCGEGLLLLNLAKLFDECVGVDLNIEAAKKFMADCNVPNVSLIEGDFGDMVFGDGLFDVIVATDVLEHIRDLSFFIKKIRGILKPGGLFIVTVPSENFFYRIGRKLFGFSQSPDSCPHLYGAKEIISVLKDEFTIQKKEFIRIKFFTNLWHRGEHEIVNSFISRFLSAFYLVKMTK